MVDRKRRSPLWRALERARSLVRGRKGDFDLISIFDVYDKDRQLKFVESALSNWEEFEVGDYEAQLKASYLLGLAVGLRYAEVPERILDQLITNYKSVREKKSESEKS